jgi:ABC-type nitrate/sulfonate/bicarbonate transport system permease component
MMRRWFPSVVMLVVLVGAWQLYCSTSGIDAGVIPPPGDVGQSLVNDSGLLWSNFKVTAGEIAAGFAIAVLSALALATAIHASALLRRAVYPLLVASQAVPIPTLSPILAVWLGYDIKPKLIIVALVCFFPIVVSTLDGLAHVDPALPKLMRTLGATRRQTYLRAELPSALPSLFSGLRIAVTVSVIAAVVAEDSAPNSGLGALIFLATNQDLIARALAAVIVLAAFAIVLFVLLGVAQRRILPWAPR